MDIVTVALLLLFVALAVLAVIGAGLTSTSDYVYHDPRPYGARKDR